MKSYQLLQTILLLTLSERSLINLESIDGEYSAESVERRRKTKLINNRKLTIKVDFISTRIN